MKTSLTCLFFAAVVFGADPAGVRYWSASELQGFDKKLSEKLGSKPFVSDPFGSLGANSLAMIAHREADGSAEIHETQNDIFVVQNGQGTIVLGGEAVDAKMTEPNELRANSIRGGVQKKLGPGDILYIPAKCPHQLLVPKGQHFTYFVIKVKE